MSNICRIHSQAGFSLIEAMASALILGFVVWGSSHLYITQSKVNQQSSIESQILQTRQSLYQTLLDYDSWQATIQYENNKNVLSCLKNETNCYNSKGWISVLNQKQQVISSFKKTQGWTIQGLQCQNFHTNPTECIFRWNIFVETICDSDPCFYPLIKIKFNLEVQSDLSINPNKYNFEFIHHATNESQENACSMLRGQLINGICEVPYLAPCPSGTYLVGFQNYERICKSLSAVFCPPNSFVNSIFISSDKKELQASCDTIAKPPWPPPYPPVLMRADLHVGCRGRVDRGHGCNDFYYLKTENGEDVFECKLSYGHKCGKTRSLGFTAYARIPQGKANTATDPKLNRDRLLMPEDSTQPLDVRFECQGWSSFTGGSTYCQVRGLEPGWWPK